MTYSTDEQPDGRRREQRGSALYRLPADCHPAAEMIGRQHRADEQQHERQRVEHAIDGERRDGCRQAHAIRFAW